MNWYKFVQSAVKKPFNMMVYEESGRIVKYLTKPIYADNERQAFQVAKNTIKNFDAIMREKRLRGDRVEFVLDKTLFEEEQKNLAKSKERKEEQIEMRWDLKY